MDRKQIFELLQLPLVPSPGGDLILFEDKRTVRRIALHGTDFQVRDIATWQGRLPWIITARELFVLTEEGNRELGFDVDRMAPIGSGHFYSPMVASDPAADANYFLLNGAAGAWPLQLSGQELSGLTTEPLPFLGSCAWTREDRICFGGMTPRPRAPGPSGKASQGQPAVASFRPGATSNGRVLHTIEPLTVSAQWQDTLSRYALSARELKQLSPECCIAVAQRHTTGLILIGLVAEPNWEDALDELCVQPLNSEYLGYLLVALDGRTVASGAVFRHVLSALQTDAGMTWAYTIDNRGRGGAIGSLTRLDFDPSEVHPERPVTFAGIDLEAICRKFRIFQHPRVGYIATAEIGRRAAKATAHYLQSADGLHWTVVGRDGEVEQRQPS